MLVRVDEYAKNAEGKIQDTDHGVRVNPSHIIEVGTAITGYEVNGEDTTDVYRVRFSNGMTVWTNSNGKDDINSWSFPIDLP